MNNKNSDNLTQELKGCPCCGDLAWMHSAPVFEYGVMGHRIECEGKCHLMTCYWHTKAEAIKAWNTRHQPEQQEVAGRMPPKLDGFENVGRAYDGCPVYRATKAISESDARAALEFFDRELARDRTLDQWLQPHTETFLKALQALTTKEEG